MFKESLRLYPPVWSMGREVTTATSLAGQSLQKGTDIWICLHRLHRDERWFAQSEHFLPERWLQEDMRRPFTNLPFGLGPRVCIGQHFATAESVLSDFAPCCRVSDWNSLPTNPLNRAPGSPFGLSSAFCCGSTRHNDSSIRIPAVPKGHSH